MAERKATNKWIPPDFDPAKHGSVNAYHGSHPLRERARHIQQGILTIRFEMPFNVWCLHCNKHIGMGVRYNAQKKKIGMYYTTPILEFRMKCHLCSGWFVIHTDPKNAQYVCVEGVRRKMEDYVAAPDTTGQVLLESEQVKNRLAQDAFFRLEHEHGDQLKEEEVAPLIDQLTELSDRQWRDPFEVSKRVRKHFRDDKAEWRRDLAERKALQDKHSLLLAIQPATEADQLTAAEISFSAESERRDRADKALKFDSGLFLDPPMSSADRTCTRQHLFETELRRKRKIAQTLDRSSASSLGIVKRSSYPAEATANPLKQQHSLVNYPNSDDADTDDEEDANVVK